MIFLYFMRYCLKLNYVEIDDRYEHWLVLTEIVRLAE